MKDTNTTNNHLFNKENIDFTMEPLFLGKGRNISRLDLNIEQGIQKQTDNALGLMWFATDFSYKDDAKDYTEMGTKLNNLFLKNLKFQTLLDSVASRTVAEVFIPITTNPQLESWWYQHAFMENNVHSKTYAEIIKSLPVNAKEIFDDIMINEHILNRAAAIMKPFEDCVILNAKRLLKTADYNEFKHQKVIALSLYALNILEAVLFKSSFITSFAYKENGIMNSVGDAIKKIQLDEIGHYAMTVNLINRLSEDPTWAAAFEAVKDDARNMYKQAIDADYVWIDYLFEDNPELLGIGSDILKQYVDYNAKKVMTSVKIKPFKKDTFNPCAWSNKYIKSSNIQTAMKEKNSANYLLGKLDTSTPLEFWVGMRKYNEY